ncbi:MAG: ATP-binding protein [Bacteroidetes bacterium]|nr:ATP-binding protein [Bacteroidota bacterium]
MHGVRTELLDLQAQNIGLPLVKMMIPENPTMQDYEKVMSETLSVFKEKGITHSVFGDIFLEDLRKYREDKLALAGFTGVFPLWKQPTDELIREFIDLGFKTVITCVNEKYLDKSFAGRIIDYDFLNDLPENVDPCGENGEFHTFVFEGPIFKNSIAIETGEIIYRKYNSPSNNTDACNDPYETGFWYCDLLPKL